jgi:hypothetical protein
LSTVIAPAIDCIEVYRLGAIVELDSLVEARITAITLREGSILYECVWWNERERNVEMVEPWEIVKAVDEEKLRICQVL